MIAYAIRHKPTGKFMPTEYQRGSTYWAPEIEPASLPRLFKRPSDAKASMRFWAMGKWRNEPVQSSFESFGPDDVELSYEPVPGRSLDDLEVVQLFLVKQPEELAP